MSRLAASDKPRPAPGRNGRAAPAPDLFAAPAPAPSPGRLAERAFKATVTPEMAEGWLAHNKGNRPASRTLVRTYAARMAAGRWMVTGDAIVFDREGALRNGQHRLLACVEAGVPFDSWVVCGVDPAAFRAMDRGRRRTNADDLAVVGEVNGKHLAAAAAVLHRDGLGQIAQVDRAGVETDHVLAILEAHPGLRDSVSWAHGRGARIPVQCRLLAFCHYRFGRLDPEAAAAFFDDLIEGVGLPKGDPVLLLRDRLAAVAASKAKLPALEVLALFIKAWNYRRQGRAIRTLRWRTEGPKSEPFPAIL